MSIRLAAVGALSMAMLGTTAMAADKPTIVLVHGAFETAAVWKPVERELHKQHFKTITVTLPGRHGVPVADPAAGLAPYRDAVLNAIKAEPNPVVLVGHSFGGMTISAVGEAAPDRIKTLVYVAAYLPTSGQSLLSLSQQDPDSKVGPAFRISDDKTYAYIAPASRAELFCNDCTVSAKAKVTAGFVNEPLAPPATSIDVSPQRFGQVDKVYIHTARDLVVSPKLQAAMVSRTPVRKEITLDTGHAPFAAAPKDLALAIEAAAQ